MQKSILAAFVIAAMPCAAQDAARMDAIVQSYAANRQFMGSVLVARGSQVLLSKGYGSANLEWNVPNTPATRFRLGSLTKQFTAASILLLEERGKLKTGDLVKTYLPDAPAAWDKITIFNLLTHTSGIPNFTSFPGYAKTEPFAATPAVLVARFRDHPLDFEPGTKFNYSNSGYVLLGYLIEKISGGSYEKFVTDNIFNPLGMKDSGYDSNTAVIARHASGYAPGTNGPENAGFIHMSIPHAAGALYSTTEDLLRWEQGLFGGKLLRSESLAKMTTPFKDGYAFGLGVRGSAGDLTVSHNGGIEGFSTSLAYYTKNKITIAVLGNLEGPAPDQIGDKLAAVMSGETVTLQSERKTIDVSPQVLSRYVGAYEMQPGVAIVVTLNAGQLSEQLANQPAFPLFPESETRFFLKAVDAQVEFTVEQGKVRQLVLHQNGRDITAKRMDAAQAQRIADAAAAFAKRFKEQTQAPGTEAALRKLIEETRSGQPNYAAMIPTLAEATRQQLPQIRAALEMLGALQSLTFRSVGQGGADIYQAKFANGLVEYRISLDADGKIERAIMRPM